MKRGAKKIVKTTKTTAPIGGIAKLMALYELAERNCNLAEVSDDPEVRAEAMRKVQACSDAMVLTLNKLDPQ